MAARTSELEPRLIERLRAELAELIAVSVAYPPFFDFRANRLVTRPIDRARKEEIERFLSSVNFGPIERAEVTGPETRRFIERLIVRYLEVNEGLRGRYAARHLPRLRAVAARIATNAQRRTVGYLNGGVPDFGSRRQVLSWTNVSRHQSSRSAEERDRATRVLESALLQQSASMPLEAMNKPEPPRASPSRDAARDPLHALPHDVTVPVPATAYPDPALGASPFAAFGDNAAPVSASANATVWRVSEQPTGPLVAMPASGEPNRAPMRELPSDLYQLYGDYLDDMEPEAPRQAVAPPPPPPPQAQRPVAAPQPAQAQREQPPANPYARNDLLIFWQLRYQLEAYIRRAARSYGVPHQGGDPATVLDELRRSGFVDEADLRIAEGIFALTDRVTGQGHANEHEYRQALMLYLLYHRSHLNI